MDIQALLSAIESALHGVRGVDALVLGGSRATGTEGPHSDVDIGVYYGGDFDLAALKAACERLDDAHRKDVITDIGAWGPWINGGGWLTVMGTPVDILLRDTDKVSRCVDDCMHGIVTLDYQCGHPFAFVNSMYMGEVYHSKLLGTPDRRIVALKELLRVFPQEYKSASIRRFLWECDFSLMCGKKSVAKQDVVYASGSLFRCAMSLIHAAFSANEMYCLNEKGSLNRLLHQKGVVLPEHFGAAMEHCFSTLKKDALADAFAEMTDAYQSAKALFEGPRFSHAD